MPAISVRGVSKRYRIFPTGGDRLKEALSFGRKKYGHDYWALQDINLEVEPGTTLGILGRNGAGKSTLLSIISGILQPTSGTVEVSGRRVALFALGAGFDTEFTGRENIMLNGLILGIERQEMLEHFDDIVAFADIGEFIDQPIKTYSSGMRSRLGFAVAINVEPDVLFLDETFAVGDAVYKELALQKMYELRDSGTTTLFVSHSMKGVEDFCTEAVMLHEGRVMATGETAEVIEQYQALTSSIRAQRKQQGTEGGQTSDQSVVPDENGKTPKDPSQHQGIVSGARTRKKRLRTADERSPDQQEVVFSDDEESSGASPFKEDPDFERRVANLRGGSGEARIRNVELLDRRNRPVQVLASGATVTVRVHLEYLETVEDSEVIIVLHDAPEPEQENHFHGPNLGYVLELYECYREDPESVDERTQEFFESWNPPPVDANGHAAGAVRELFSASTTLGGIPLKEDGKGRAGGRGLHLRSPPDEGAATAVTACCPSRRPRFLPGLGRR
jgi:ABC-type polysaccharide/polyol phosphate transport system ATPase subunit